MSFRSDPLGDIYGKCKPLMATDTVFRTCPANYGVAHPDIKSRLGEHRPGWACERKDAQAAKAGVFWGSYLYVYYARLYIRLCSPEVTYGEICNSPGSSETYIYDGNGQRVQKSGPGGTTTYVYDAFGNLAAEYGAAPGAPCTTIWGWWGQTTCLPIFGVL